MTKRDQSSSHAIQIQGLDNRAHFYPASHAQMRYSWLTSPYTTECGIIIQFSHVIMKVREIIRMMIGVTRMKVGVVDGLLILVGVDGRLVQMRKRWIWMDGWKLPLLQLNP